MHKHDACERLINLLQQKGIHQREVLSAMRQVNRKNFVSEIDKVYAFEDRPLPIGCQQTISQPYIVAKMTCLLLNGKVKLNTVLEIGTGSGYQAAILSCLASKIYSIERIDALHQLAKKKLAAYKNVQLFLSDECKSVTQYGPFDGIIVTACCLKIEQNWLSSLTDGGCLVLPLTVGYCQQLIRVIRHGDQYSRECWDSVSFVPLKKGII